MICRDNQCYVLYVGMITEQRYVWMKGRMCKGKSMIFGDFNGRMIGAGMTSDFW
jgi:hypothetical protein